MTLWEKNFLNVIYKQNKIISGIQLIINIKSNENKQWIHAMSSNIIDFNVFYKLKFSKFIDENIFWQ